MKILLNIFKVIIGLLYKLKDITTISLPIFLHEPTTFLQRMCEMIQFYDLLNIVKFNISFFI